VGREELPASGAGAWAERASRRKRRSTYLLAFVPSKFRIGEEPDPFVFEVDLSGDEWKLRDATDDIVQAGERAVEEAKTERECRLATAADLLAKEVAKQVAGGRKYPLGDAVTFLRDKKLAKGEARQVIEEGDGVRWIVRQLEGRGNPKASFLPESITAYSNTPLEQIIPSKQVVIESATYKLPISPNPAYCLGEIKPHETKC
jgi:hypothetical protein